MLNDELKPAKETRFRMNTIIDQNLRLHSKNSLHMLEALFFSIALNTVITNKSFFVHSNLFALKGDLTFDQTCAWI